MGRLYPDLSSARRRTMARFRVHLNDEADVRELRSAIQSCGVTDIRVDADTHTITFDGDEIDRDAIRDLEGVEKVDAIEEEEPAD